MRLKPSREISAQIDDDKIVIAVESHDAETFVIENLKEHGALFRVEGSWKDFLLFPRCTYDFRDVVRYIETQGAIAKAEDRTVVE